MYINFKIVYQKYIFKKRYFNFKNNFLRYTLQLEVSTLKDIVSFLYDSLYKNAHIYIYKRLLIVTHFTVRKKISMCLSNI